MVVSGIKAYHGIPDAVWTCCKDSVRVEMSDDGSVEKERAPVRRRASLVPYVHLGRPVQGRTNLVSSMERAGGGRSAAGVGG